MSTSVVLEIKATHGQKSDAVPDVILGVLWVGTLLLRNRSVILPKSTYGVRRCSGSGYRTKIDLYLTTCNRP